MSSDVERLTFLGLPQRSIDDAVVRILPVPWERTVSYGSGTAAAPAAILRASQQVELWDDPLRLDLRGVPIHTSGFVCPADGEPSDDYLARLRSVAQEPGCLTIGLGGEHSMTPPLVQAARGQTDLSDVTIVQIDAHADLRSEYEGDRRSHACAMRRLTDAGASLISIGVRSLCKEESQFVAECNQIEMHTAQSLSDDPNAWAKLLDRLRALAGNVYLTVDVDGLALSLCPGTGTPEPGGLSWWETIKIVQTLLIDAAAIRLMGCDVVEAVPMPNTQINEYTAARLATKVIACAAWRSGWCDAVGLE